MNRFTKAERLALVVLLTLILLFSGVRWWNIRQAGQENRESLPPASPARSSAGPLLGSVIRSNP